MHRIETQVLTLSTRLSALTFSMGRLAADLARNFVVIGVLLLAFSSALVVLQVSLFYQSKTFSLHAPQFK